MGILTAHVHFLAKEAPRHPIKGDVLTLGQQSVHGTFAKIESIVQSYQINHPLDSSFDKKTKIPEWIGTGREAYTNAQAVFSLLGAENVYVCDYSDFEGANFTFDLNNLVDEKYFEKFDVIFDAGTLEHVFDIPTALANLDFMLKKGGQIIIMVPASNAIDHGFYSISPTLLYDYFGSLGYNNFNCYLREVEPYDVSYRGKTYNYQEVGDQHVLFSKQTVELCFFATKVKTSEGKKEQKPIQSLYRNLYSSDASKIKNEDGIVKRTVKKILKSLRPIIPKALWIGMQKKVLKSNISYIGKY